MRLVEFALGVTKNNTLNPKLWDGDSLKPEVRSALLKIAEDFKKYTEVDFVISDIQITGSQVSYAYTEHSDLDLHLITDFRDIDCDREVAELFDTKRLLYEREFDINIYGIPVGLYVEDLAMPGISQGTFSVALNKWIKTPEPVSGEIDEEEVLRMSETWEKLIRSVLVKKDVESAKNVLKSLRNYRKLGLKSSGEYGVPNLVYKTLRNSKTLEKLTDFLDREHESSLSIKQ